MSEPQAPYTPAEAEYLLLELRQRDARIASLTASLTASLDDANATIARLSSEKAQLERVIATVKETVGGF